MDDYKLFSPEFVYSQVTIGVRLILVTQPLGKCPLGRPKVKGKIKMDLRKIVCDVNKLMAPALKFRELPENV